MTTHARQPFAALDGTRLNNLTSIKNRQNAFSSTLASPAKLSLASPTKRRYSPSSFEDDLDSENLDPSIFNSPTKRAKNIDGTPLKSSKFILTDATLSASKAATASILSSAPAMVEKRKASALSVSVPNTTHATPISQSRGSPKHKRVGLLSKRRASSSPFRRVDPPSFMRAAPSSGTGLPFSIDAALSGTISSYTPKHAKTTESNASSLFESKPVRMLEEAMPKSWFFDIHEDTPEEEAANLMEHSALCLDISSDDDEETKRQNLEKEMGKENVPPPDFITNASPARAAAADSSKDVLTPTTKSRFAKKFDDLDVMLEDRKALSDLNAADFYPDGLDALSVIVAVEEVAEDHHVEFKPSGLVHETKLEAEIQPGQAPEEPVLENSNVNVWIDETTPPAVEGSDVVTAI